MQTKEGRIIDRIGIVLLYTAPVAGVCCYCLLTNDTAIDVFSNLILALILAGMHFTLLHMNQGYLYHKISHKMLYFISFFLSFIILGAAVRFPVGVFWMTVVAVAAIDCGLELAVATHIALMIQYVFLLLPQDHDFYRFSGYILFGMVIAILFSVVKESAVVFYLALILLTCDGILQLVSCRFSLSWLEENRMAALIEMGSVLFIVLAGMFYLKKCGVRHLEADIADFLDISGQAFKDTKKREERQKESGQEAEESKEEIQLRALIAPDYELLLRLQGYSEELLGHSQRIGMLSEKAAEAIGGNKALAKAGGLFHEIGRIENEDDYIRAGIRIGQEYGFPERLLAVMRQHSTGFELPESIEAAVVMLSDCIVSTSEYLIKNGKRGMLSDEQLVNSVFQNRLKKGNLQSSGMTSEQIRELQDFYIRNAFSTVSKGIK